MVLGNLDDDSSRPLTNPAKGYKYFVANVAAFMRSYLTLPSPFLHRRSGTKLRTQAPSALVQGLYSAVQQVVSRLVSLQMNHRRPILAAGRPPYYEDGAFRAEMYEMDDTDRMDSVNEASSLQSAASVGS